MRRHKYKKHYKWTNNIAYLVGLIASDGCLLNNGRHLNITSKDYELVEITQKILVMNVKVQIKQSGYGGKAFHLQFSNVAFYDFLVDCGLTPAKSKTIGILKVPSAYYNDFLRGYFDGDGTVYGYWDKRWPNSLMYYKGYVSASLSFLEWMRQINMELHGTSFGKIKTNKRAFTLTYAKKDSKKLYDAMYYNSELPKLTRKYKKFNHFLLLDPYAKIAPDARVL